MGKIKAFAFDFDGVIGKFELKNVIKSFDAKDQIKALRVIVHMMGSLKQSKEFKQWVYEYECNKYTQEEFAKKIGNRYPDVATIAIPMLNRIPLSCVFYDDMLKFIEQVRNNGYKTAIITNNLPENKPIIQNSMADKVDDIIFSTDIGYVKSSPEIFLLASQKLGVKPQEMVFIDNKKDNVICAKSVGMSGIVCTKPTNAIKEAVSLIRHDNNFESEI